MLREFIWLALNQNVLEPGTESQLFRALSLRQSNPEKSMYKARPH